MVKDGGNSSGLDVRLAFTVLYGPYHMGSVAGRGAFSHLRKRRVAFVRIRSRLHKSCIEYLAT